MINKICEFCKKDFSVKPSELKYRACKFCSKKCRFDWQIPENHPNWKGGRNKHNAGYILIRMKEHPNSNSNGYILEHRVVMENKIGRYLEPQEAVHHINGKKWDNRIENLMLFSTNSEHKKFETKMNLPKTFNVKCFICKKPIHRKQSYLNKITHTTCGIDCRKELLKKVNIGKKNPNFRHGRYVKNKTTSQD